MSSPRLPLGSSGLHVHPLCLGGNVFGWTVDGEAACGVLDAYVAAGGNFVDTADAYSAWVDGHAGGESEALIGRWLAGRGPEEPEVVVATKAGWSGGLGRDALRRSAEASLERLGVERLPLYYAHQDDPGTPLEETLGAFDELVQEGLVGAIGASNYSEARLREALRISDERGLVSFSVLQPGYNLLDRAGYEDGLRDLCAQRGIGVAPYAALASGFLSGKYRRDAEGNPEGPRAARVAKRFGDERAWTALDAVERVAEAHGVAPAAVAVAWVAAQPGIVSPIASATSTQQLADLLAGATLELSAGELASLDAAAPGP